MLNKTGANLKSSFANWIADTNSSLRKEAFMETKQIANLTLRIDPEALHSVISSGRLLEFVDTVASQAAAQISAQLVQHVAEGAIRPDSLKAGVSAEVSYRLVTGDGEPGFGTSPRPPRFVVTTAQNVQPGMRQLAAAASPESQG
jgi:hypothetical protein